MNCEFRIGDRVFAHGWPCQMKIEAFHQYKDDAPGDVLAYMGCRSAFPIKNLRHVQYVIPAPLAVRRAYWAICQWAEFQSFVYAWKFAEFKSNRAARAKMKAARKIGYKVIGNG